MKREFISPKGEWHRFKDDDEKMLFLKKNSLISKKSNELKQIYYNGMLFDTPQKCDVLGYVDLDIAVIKISGELHCIAIDYLKETQLTKAEKKAYGME